MPIKHSALDLPSSTYWLCDFEQITQSLRASLPHLQNAFFD